MFVCLWQKTIFRERIILAFSTVPSLMILTLTLDPLVENINLMRGLDKVFPMPCQTTL